MVNSNVDVQKCIIDPTRTNHRQAILNFASIASVIITTGAVVVSIKDYEVKSNNMYMPENHSL